MYEEVTVAQKAPLEDTLGDEKTPASDEPTAAPALAQDDLLASQRAHTERFSARNHPDGAPRSNADGASEANAAGASEANGDRSCQKGASAPQTDPEATPAKASAADGEASPPASPAPLTGEPGDPNDLESLRRELTALRRAVFEQKESDTRAELEYREFLELYPEKSLLEMPDDVRESLARGVPLAAAFALSERRRARIEERAREANRANRARSLEEIRTDRNGYFTPDEVRSMSPEEVRRYYSDIRASMLKWS